MIWFGFGFLRQVSPCSLCCLGTFSVDQVDLKLTKLELPLPLKGLVLVWVFEVDSHPVAQAGFKLTAVLLPQPPNAEITGIMPSCPRLGCYIFKGKWHGLVILHSGG